MILVYYSSEIIEGPESYVIDPGSPIQLQRAIVRIVCDFPYQSNDNPSGRTMEVYYSQIQTKFDVLPRPNLIYEVAKADRFYSLADKSVKALLQQYLSSDNTTGQYDELCATLKQGKRADVDFWVSQQLYKNAFEKAAEASRIGKHLVDLEPKVAEVELVTEEPPIKSIKNVDSLPTQAVEIEHPKEIVPHKLNEVPDTTVVEISNNEVALVQNENNGPLQEIAVDSEQFLLLVHEFKMKMKEFEQKNNLGA